MTNKKAREILNILKEYERAYQYSKEEVVGALDMANKALEQTSWIPVSERLLDKQDWGDEDLNDYSVTVQATILVANTIKDEIARMCVAEDLAVIDALYVHAHNNLENLYRLVQEANSKRE